MKIPQRYFLATLLCLKKASFHNSQRLKIKLLECECIQSLTSIQVIIRHSVFKCQSKCLGSIPPSIVYQWDCLVLVWSHLLLLACSLIDHVNCIRIIQIKKLKMGETRLHAVSYTVPQSAQAIITKHHRPSHIPGDWEAQDQSTGRSGPC